MSKVIPEGCMIAGHSLTNGFRAMGISVMADKLRTSSFYEAMICNCIVQLLLVDHPGKAMNELALFLITILGNVNNRNKNPWNEMSKRYSFKGEPSILPLESRCPHIVYCHITSVLNSLHGRPGLFALQRLAGNKTCKVQQHHAF